MCEIRFMLVGGAIGLLIGLVSGSLAAREKAIDDMQTEAVKHGAATWEVKDDGSTTFKWKGTP